VSVLTHETTYPTNFAEDVSQLPEYIDQAILNGRGLYVVEGLSMALADQLPKLSQQKAIAWNCEGDYYDRTNQLTGAVTAGRFRDRATTTKWQSKQRESYMLVSKTDQSGPLESANLTTEGIIWFGPQKPGDKEPQIDGADITFAMRIYEGRSGQGNAGPFIRAALDSHSKKHGSNDGVWLEAYGDNEPALATYAKHGGFTEITRIMGERHGESVERVYMGIGAMALVSALG
jgi:hypothetical protein